MPDYTQGDLMHLANTIYGEGASEDYNTMLMQGSTVMNRLNANKAGEFGGSLGEVIDKGYYAARSDKQGKPSPMYLQAMMQQFPDKHSENKYKIALQIASGLLKGTIEPVEGQFYFKPDEVKSQRKAGFKFDLTKKVGKTGKYTVFAYK